MTGEAMNAMPKTPKGEILVDARGRMCPIPTLRLRRALERASPGARVRLLADDPVARIDVPHFAAAAGVEILELTSVGGTISVLVRVPVQPDVSGEARRTGGKRRAARMILSSS
jgi:tRNA 2-thiouridine synthesizing protein A